MKYGIDNFISDSKDAIDKLAVKANSAVNVSKAYVEKAQLRDKLKERYAELGKLCYKMHNEDTDESGNMKRLIKDIKTLEMQLEYADEASGRPKVCMYCGAKNDSDNVYCCQCGEKLGK